MAIKPMSFPQYTVDSTADFSPLARLGQLGQRDDTLAALGQRYGSSVAPAGAPAAASTNPVDSQLRTIAGIESGGRYDAMGPVTKGGDQAIGKYQIMGNNVPEWTRDALGKAMTPEEFLSSPQAQEATARHRWGYYLGKYGPSGAARAWFAGESGMNNPNARDILGTSVADYERRFQAGQ